MKHETSPASMEGALAVTIVLALLLVAALVRLGVTGEEAFPVPTPSLLPTPPVSVPLATSTAEPATEPTTEPATEPVATPIPSPTATLGLEATVTPFAPTVTPATLPATGSR
jgi:hypothetical protein